VSDQTVVKGLQRGELAERTGSNPETVRYYEKIGLLPEPPRTPGGHRVYDGNHERRLRFVLRARELGFSLEQIRGLLKLADEHDRPCPEARSVAARHLADVRSKVTDLKRIERVLKGVLAECGDGELSLCPLIETLFRGPPLR
jgi:MerR family mercuric resistance operon transcriptional regulator